MTADTARPAAPQVLARALGGRTLLFEYQVGEGLPPHTHPGQAVVVAVLCGRLRLSVDGQTRELPAGEVTCVQTDGFFSSQALEDPTRVLVTLLGLA